MTANNIASLIVRNSVRGSPIRGLILGGILLIAAIMIGTTMMAGNFRERALSSSERELENTVLLLARHFDQQIEDFEAIQKDLIAHMRSNGVDSSENFKRQMSGRDIHWMLKSKMSALSYIGGVAVFDADGQLLNTSVTWPAPVLNVSDRPYFKAFKNDPRSPEMLIEPVHSRVTGIWTIVIARKMTGPNGEFLGVVGRGIEPAKFEDFFASVSLGDDAVISMFHLDGTMLARYPHVEAMIGQSFASAPLFRDVLSKSDHGTLRLNSPADGEEKLGSARRLSHFPIVMVATTTVSAALADWRDQIRFLIAAAGLCVLVIAVMLFLVVRRLSQQHRLSQQRLALEKQRLDTAVNNMTQGLLLFDASQQLVVCNQRYIEMYGLSPEAVKPGCSFREVIACIERPTGSFKGDVGQVLRPRAPRHRDCGGHMTSSRPPTGAPFRSSTSRWRTADGSTTHEDITERKRSRGADHPPRALRCADRPAEPHPVSRIAEAGTGRHRAGQAIGGALHRHRRIQERQRFARTSDRR